MGQRIHEHVRYWSVKFVYKGEDFIDILESATLKEELHDFQLISVFQIFIAYQPELFFEDFFIVFKELRHPLVGACNVVNHIKDFVESKGFGHLDIFQIFVVIFFKILCELFKILHDVFQVVNAEMDVKLEEFKNFMDLLFRCVSHCQQKVYVKVVMASNPLVKLPSCFSFLFAILGYVPMQLSQFLNIIMLTSQSSTKLNFHP